MKSYFKLKNWNIIIDNDSKEETHFSNSGLSTEASCARDVDILM